MRGSSRETTLAAVHDALRLLHTDNDIRTAFYEIEYGRLEYNESFHGSDAEKRVDALLYLLASVALQVESGLLTDDDLKWGMSYYFIRIIENSEVQQYLEFVKNWSTDQGIQSSPIQTFATVATRLQADRPISLPTTVVSGNNPPK